MAINTKATTNKGLTNKANKNTIIATTPVQIYHVGIPSLFSTKINAKKIIALPASGWSNINPIGTQIIAKAIYWNFLIFKFTWASLKNLAISSEQEIFTTSEG